MKSIIGFLHKSFIPGEHNHHRPHAFRHHMLSLYSMGTIFAHLSLGMVMYSPVATNLSEIKSGILSGINAERTKISASKLKENETLSKAAEAKLKDMFEKNYWDHTSPEGEKAWSFINRAGYYYEKAGENLARGFVSSDSMVKAWMASPTHKENILDKNFLETGVAVGNGIINGKVATVSVQLFGKASAAPNYAPNQNQALVAGEKTTYPRVSAENALSERSLPFFFLFIIILAFIIFDGLMLKIHNLHKKKKHIFHFRASLSLSLILLLVLTLNLAFIS